MPRKARLLVVAVLAGLLVATAVVWYTRPPAATPVLTGSGTIEATTSRISAELPGRVEEVLVAEGQAVAAGDELLRLAAAGLEAQRAQAEARVAAADAAIDAAEAMVRAAEANARLAEAGGSDEQVAAAEAQADAARAQLEAARADRAAAGAAHDLIETQIAALVLTSPTDGVVLMRAIEPGEYAVPGAPLIEIGRLDALTITVYVPEDRYGEVTVGQTARVRVDSFPAESFAATVARIADEAEFTPRNVQTAEGRRSTVFAIHLAIDNADARLKPGMPADVEF